MENNLHFPVLETHRLRLNKLSINDEDALYHHFSHAEVVEYYDLAAFSSREQSSNLIHLFNKRFAERMGIRWAIRLKESGDFVGTCGFNSWNQRMKSSVIGYDISRQYWGNGYATEALKGMIDFGFAGHLPCGELNRIQGDTVPGNSASEAVLKKLGFKEEGLLRQSGYWKGRFHDLKCFGLIKSEYLKALSDEGLLCVSEL